MVAVSMMIDIMRIELAPLYVKVVTIVAGTVKSEFFDNAFPTNLSQGSFLNFYIPVSSNLYVNQNSTIHVADGEQSRPKRTKGAAPVEKLTKKNVDNDLEGSSELLVLGMWVNLSYLDHMDLKVVISLLSQKIQYS